MSKIHRRKSKPGQKVKTQSGGKSGVPFRFGGNASLDCYAATYEMELTLPEFEQYAAKRMTVLRWINDQKGLGKEVNVDTIAPILRESGLDRDHKMDNISHFIVRLGFCNQEDNRKWFLTQEVELFKLRYQLAMKSGEDCARVVDELMGQKFEEVSKQQLFDLGLQGRAPLPRVDKAMGNYIAQAGPWGGNTMSQFPYYKVSVLDSAVYWMIQNRRVFLKDGFAYVPADQFKSIVFGRYRTQLSKLLLECRSKLRELKEDQRVYNIIANLHKATVGDKYKSKAQAGQIKPKDLPKLASQKSIPMCMMNSYNYLKADSHLKHTARMHFGLFLKGIGLSMEDALKFWAKSFSKKMSGEKFMKNYAYNIRHNYGKEGHRKALSAYSCNSIIKGSYANDDHAGCPFQMCDAETLGRKLRGMGLNALQTNEIVEKAQGKHYQIACRKVFRYSHLNVIRQRNMDWEYDVANENTSNWNHPNAYFELSRQLHNGEPLGKAGKADDAIPDFGSKTRTAPSPAMIQPMQTGVTIQPMATGDAQPMDTS